MSEFASGDQLQLRYETLHAKLAAVIGDVHPRLSDPANRLSVGDENASALTYGDIVLRTATGESPDLIPGAHKVFDDEVSLLLTEGHVARVEDYLTAFMPGEEPQSLAEYVVIGHRDAAKHFGLQRQALHPKVDGYEWYRGLYIPTYENDAVLLFTPWMQPWEPEGSPAPLMYALGTPDITIVRSIAAAYSEHERTTIQPV